MAELAAGRGRLVLVGTPLGNLGDLSPRAVEALRAADLLACEDTRRTGRLLVAAGIAAPRYLVVNEHTEAGAAARIVDEVRRGSVVALVTDAGMPAVSDPGERVVAAAVAAGLAVDVVPGPAAAITALAVSGLPSARFVFEGFLPRKGSERGRRLVEVAAEQRTVILYEAPHRMARTLADLLSGCGAERPVAVARELTKLHQEVYRGTLAGAVEWLGEPRGEYVIVLGGAPVPVGEVGDDELRAAVVDARARGASTKDAAAAVAARFGVPRRRVYDLAVDT